VLFDWGRPSAELETRYVHDVEQKYADRVFLIPWKVAEAGDPLNAEVAMTGAIHE
jgi:hypothetical protein